MTFWQPSRLRLRFCPSCESGSRFNIWKSWRVNECEEKTTRVMSLKGNKNLLYWSCLLSVLINFKYHRIPSISLCAFLDSRACKQLNHFVLTVYAAQHHGEYRFVRATEQEWRIRQKKNSGRAFQFSFDKRRLFGETGWTVVQFTRKKIF